MSSTQRTFSVFCVVAYVCMYSYYAFLFVSSGIWFRFFLLFFRKSNFLLFYLQCNHFIPLVEWLWLYLSTHSLDSRNAQTSSSSVLSVISIWLDTAYLSHLFSMLRVGTVAVAGWKSNLQDLLLFWEEKKRNSFRTFIIHFTQSLCHSGICTDLCIKLGRLITTYGMCT